MEIKGFENLSENEFETVNGGGWGSWAVAAVGVVLCFTPAAPVGYVLAGGALGWDLLDNIFK